jgi:hypothetical protein
MTTTIPGKPLTHKLFAAQVIRELENKAREKMKGKKLTMIDEADEYVTQKIIEYNSYNRWIYEKEEMDQKRFLRILKRIKSEAVGEMVDQQAANESQVRQLGVTEDDILFEIELKQLLSDWVELESDESLPARQGLRAAAIGGKRMNYCKLITLEDKLKSIRDHEKRLLDIGFNRMPEREKYDKYGHEIEYPPEKNISQDISEELREIITRRIHIKNEITKENWRISKEKSKTPNLCYYILYDEYRRPDSNKAVRVVYDPITSNVIGFEDNDRVNYRIQNLSKHYLTIMVGVICKINNEYFKDDIETNRRTLKKMNRQTKKISIPEKRELIQMGKAEGLTNEQISKQLGKGFGLRTVERYSK